VARTSHPSAQVTSRRDTRSTVVNAHTVQFKAVTGSLKALKRRRRETATYRTHHHIFLLDKAFPSYGTHGGWNAAADADADEARRCEI